MQMIRRLLRKLVYPAAVLSVFWAAYLVMARPYISDPTGKITVIYDADSDVKVCEKGAIPQDPENDSVQALAGFCEALPKDGSADLLNLHDEIHTDSEAKDARIYTKLAARLAGRSSRAVVSFLSSPDSLPIVRFCRTVQIPLLLVLAANDDLMAPGEDTRGLVFRMMPTNGRQARNISQWIKDKEKDKVSAALRVALFHEPNSFGEFLHRQLIHELQDETTKKRVIFYQFEATDDLQFADLMPQLWCQEIDSVVYLGFKPRALDLLNKLRAFSSKNTSCGSEKKSHQSFDALTILLSSASYQPDLNDPAKYQFPFHIFAMLPTQPSEFRSHVAKAKDDTSEQETEAYAYGYDSVGLLKQLVENRFQTPMRPLEDTKTGHAFTFDEDGELMPADKNQYHALALTYSRARKTL